VKSTIGFLLRNLNIGSSFVKENVYKTLVRPTVECASTVWEPYTRKEKYRLEIPQRRTARYVKNSQWNTSSVSYTIDALGWKTQEERRRESRLCMLYKVTINLVAINKEKRLLQPTRFQGTLSRKRSYLLDNKRQTTERNQSSQGPPGSGIYCHPVLYEWKR
jgi:hypothetical protein